jgi:hypothetical protein
MIEVYLMAQPFEGPGRRDIPAMSAIKSLNASSDTLRNSNFSLIVGSWPDARIAPEPISAAQKGAIE